MADERGIAELSSYQEMEAALASRKRAVLLARRTATSASTASAASPSPMSTARVGPSTTASMVAPAATSAAMIASAVATAVTAERLRIREILEAPEARGREKSAASLAYSTDMAASAAKNMLSTLRKDGDVEIEKAAAQITRFRRRST